MLVLATHTIQSAPSATVPFAVILLQDHISNKKIPADLKCRQLVPSSGSVSTSLWDVNDKEALQQWLDEAINVDVKHEVYEVQEEFAIGLGEVARARAAEKVVVGTKHVAETTVGALGAAATTVGHQVNELDHKLRISERASAAGTAIKESAVGRTAGAAFSKIGTASKKVLDSDKVATATGAVGTSFKKLGASLSSLTGRKKEAAGGEVVPQFVQDEPYEPPAAQQPFHGAPEPAAPEGGAAARNPPVAAAAAGGGSPGAEQQLGVAPPAFTLDDSEAREVPKAP